MMHDALPVVVTDPFPRDVAPRSVLERACMHWLRDGRDLVFCRLTLRATVTLVLCAVVVLAAPPWLAWILALPYFWLLYAIFSGPVMLMVHAIEHRATFTRRGSWLQAWICRGHPIFYGISPYAYRPHHVLMHHAEENRVSDLSSTLHSRRDSRRAFCRYCLHFVVMGNVDLARYLHALRTQP